MIEPVPMPYFPVDAVRSLQLLCAVTNWEEIQKFSDLKKVTTNRAFFDKVLCADLPDIFSDWNFLFEFFILPNKKRWQEILKAPPFPRSVDEVENSPAFLELKAELEEKLAAYRARYFLDDENDFSRALIYPKCYEMVCRAIARADELGIENFETLQKYVADMPRFLEFVRGILAENLNPVPNLLCEQFYYGCNTIMVIFFGRHRAQWEDIIQMRYFPFDPAELFNCRVYIFWRDKFNSKPKGDSEPPQESPEENSSPLSETEWKIVRTNFQLFMALVANFSGKNADDLHAYVRAGEELQAILEKDFEIPAVQARLIRAQWRFFYEILVADDPAPWNNMIANRLLPEDWGQRVATPYFQKWQRVLCERIENEMLRDPQTWARLGFDQIE